MTNLNAIEHRVFAIQRELDEIKKLLEAEENHKPVEKKEEKKEAPPKRPAWHDNETDNETDDGTDELGVCVHVVCLDDEDPDIVLHELLHLILK